MTAISPDAAWAAGSAYARSLRTLYGLDGTSVEEAARRAHTPAGPSIDELVARIADARREAAVA